MKGVVFNLLRAAVADQFGENTWDDLLDVAGLDGAYTSLGNYSDADLLALVAAASSALKQEPGEILRWFGRSAVPLLLKLYPRFFEGHDGTQSFLLTLNEIIHPEVRKLYPGADVPEFDFHNSADGSMVMGYSSPRKFCAFAEGLIQGAASHFGEQVGIEQPRCMHRGDEKCLLAVTVHKPELN